jgi:formamidopyrimidine-DNA glycosylase
MPELPEVEVTRQSFADRIEGASVRSVHMGKPLRWPVGHDVDALHGWQVGKVLRRGKYLWLPLTRPDGAQGGLLVHLGMSGSLSFSHRLPPAGVHDHFEMVTDKGTLRLTDPRRFGSVVWGPSMHEGMPGKLLQGLGLEPFDETLNGAYLHARLQGRSVAIKQALLSGDIVVGAGNIYACEALFRAGIDPRVPARRLSKPRCEKLVREVQAVLQQAIALPERFQGCARRPRAFSIDYPGLRTRRPALPCLRHAHSPLAARATLHVLLPKLSKKVTAVECLANKPVLFVPTRTNMHIYGSPA